MMNTNISDLPQRQQALDPTKSFIVQAPAGSGKTSLLVQRYLRLLAMVNAPEEITVITFTRKAAYEIRDRIINLLQPTFQNIEPQDQYTKTTQQLAQKVLQQNEKKSWDLRQNPNRLRVQTIDSFCNYLTRQMPILTNVGTTTKIIQGHEAEIYYRDTARMVFEHLNDPQYACYLETILLHLDNDWQRTENLFISMLKSREQWLPHIVGLKDTQALRLSMEAALKTVGQENLERCRALLPLELQEKLGLLLNFAKNNQENPPVLPQEIIMDFSKMELEHWHGIASFLLTEKFTWRKQVTKKHGFPAVASGNNKAEKELFKIMKLRMESLLQDLQAQENLRQALENLANSPSTNYSNQQWQIVAALLNLLPILAAQLKVVFQEQGVLDHAEISMAALRALGNEMPSDLALTLDYHLQHLLVDEFQDTSVAQYRLIEKLITTWQPDDGRTLFVVGDPMQSIYRFRETEVGLFLRAQNDGIGMLKLQPLTLTTNFRSEQNIVSWINENFKKIFPDTVDISLGAVPFTPATAIKSAQHSCVTVELLKNVKITTEATHVVTTIKNLQEQNPNASIAVLAKARKHFQEIVTAIRNANLTYQAHDLEILGAKRVVQDLFALTQALYHLADRIAWLAILRAPWCGLNLKDLHAIATPSKIIWDNICQSVGLSPEGQQLISKFRHNFAPFVANRGRIAWRDLVETAWLALGGPATVTSEVELEYATAYLDLLSNYLDLETIQKKLNELYAPTTQTANIQVMTIHKAKGLEFDHVIIPGIDRPTKSSERKLMLWFERPRLHGGSDLLLAPIEAKGGVIDPVYKYLQLVEQKKNYYENGRLFYVALTRAKKSAHIIGCLNQDNIPKESLLKQLEPCFNTNWIQTASAENGIVGQPKTQLQRLSKAWSLPITLKTPAPTIAPTWQMNYNQAAILGTAIHYCLRQLSELDTWDIIAHQLHWRKVIQQLGYINIDHGLELLNQAIKLTLTDERGRWILGKHKFAENELAITTNINGKPEQIILDRTFVTTDNTRWIIDYKTSQPQQDVPKFLAQEKSLYTPQLLNYAKIMQELDPTKPIKLGLYFPFIGGWVEIKN